MSDNIANAYKRIASQVNIPGFRGKGAVGDHRSASRAWRCSLEEAINEVLPKAYEDAITENEVIAVGP